MMCLKLSFSNAFVLYADACFCYRKPRIVHIKLHMHSIIRFYVLINYQPKLYHFLIYFLKKKLFLILSKESYNLLCTTTIKFSFTLSLFLFSRTFYFWVKISRYPSWDFKMCFIVLKSFCHYWPS